MQSEEEQHYLVCFKYDFIKEMEEKVERIVEHDIIYKQILKGCHLKITEDNPRAYSHGLSHGVNTAYNLLNLAERYNLDILSRNNYDAIAASILHDLNRPYEVHENNGIAPNGDVSAKQAYSLLASIYGDARARETVKIIKYHDDPSRASHDEELMRVTALVRASDILDVDVVRALACAYEYTQLKNIELSPEEVMRRWKKKVDFDLNSLRNARLDHRIMGAVEQHYAEVSSNLESLAALEKHEGLHESMNLAMRDFAIIQMAREEACREVVSQL